MLRRETARGPVSATQRLASWLGQRALRLPALRRDGTPVPGESRPLFFFHIPKTAGTTTVAALRAMLRPDAVITERGVLSLARVQKAVAAGLSGGQFIHGHPGHGVGAALYRRTRMVTLLREPRAHVVSNYLFLRGDPANPHAEAAQRLGFSAFIRAHPYYAVFQAGSLCVGMEREPLAGTAEIVARVPLIQSFLAGMHLVGTTERLDDFFAALAAPMGRKPPPLRHLRRGKGGAEEVARLRAELAVLERDPALAPLFAAERAVYDCACRLAARQPQSEATTFT